MGNSLVIYENIYQTSISEINKLSNKLNEENIELEKILKLKTEEGFQGVSSNLDIYDYVFAIFFGIAGATISTNEQIEAFSNQVHKHASGTDVNKSNSIQSFLGNLLRHKGDVIDIPLGVDNFIDRSGNNSYGLYHRLFWGHDILSLQGDNPFLLMIRQNGLMLGIIQTFRHLVGDTFSKQGLPLLGSSYLDFTKEHGKTSNYLLNIVQDISRKNGDGGLAQDYYRHMFTIRAQDIAAQGLVYATGQAYFYCRGINDNIRQIQYKIISYTVNLITHAFIGSIKQGGVPYISWPALTMVIKEVANLYIKSNRETKRLAKITEKMVRENDYLIKANEKLEKEVFNMGLHLKSNDSGREYLQDYLNEENSSLDLIDFFEEG